MLNPILTDAQLKAQLEKCEYCEEKPCKKACPADCSPADFIMAALVGDTQDIGRAAAEIMMNNPLGGVCGVVCPDRYCQAACVHAGFSTPVEIPSVQATVVARAKSAGVMPKLADVPANGKRIAVLGAGPAGLGAAALLARKGYHVEVLEGSDKPGGACNLIPEERLPRDILQTDIDFILSMGNIELKCGQKIDAPGDFLNKGFDGVVVATGLTEPYKLDIIGESAAIAGLDYLASPKDHSMKGRCVAVVGGGATALDCAATAKRQGAKHVELFALERFDEMPLTPKERQELVEEGIAVTGRTRVLAIDFDDKGVGGIEIIKVSLPPNTPFSPRAMMGIAGTVSKRPDVDAVIVAIGSRAAHKEVDSPVVITAGDCDHGPSSVVAAVAGGKNAAMALHEVLEGNQRPKVEDPKKSTVTIPGYDKIPVSLEVDFFGRKLISPFILSAAPPTDGYDQMKSAFEAGWAGGIMKTAFDGIPIHIPGEYMHAFDRHTYGNCDNVSGHSLGRVCEEIRQLVKEFPDRLVVGSTGGPVTGNDEADKKGWQSNTKKLEDAGSMAIEYSLSCPQGGDGTEGDIVAQNAALTAKIIDWVMEAGDPEVPKLFKLTGAVTSIYPIITAVGEVFKRYPNKKGGVTLANTFPTLTFRKGSKTEWDEGIVVGMSGQGVSPISNLTLAMAGSLGVTISGNGGPMDYDSAAQFLALGARTVQFCTVAMKYGYGIVEELHSGLSHLLAARGLSSVEALIGIAQPNPIADFMALSPVKKISHSEHEICQSCGNCTRCSYTAISLDDEKKPIVDPAKCIGCSICVQKCFAGALAMRDRTAEETEALKEH